MLSFQGSLWCKVCLFSHLMLSGQNLTDLETKIWKALPEQRKDIFIKYAYETYTFVYVYKLTSLRVELIHSPLYSMHFHWMHKFFTEEMRRWSYQLKRKSKVTTIFSTLKSDSILLNAQKQKKLSNYLPAQMSFSWHVLGQSDSSEAKGRDSQNVPIFLHKELWDRTSSLIKTGKINSS